MQEFSNMKTKKDDPKIILLSGYCEPIIPKCHNISYFCFTFYPPLTFTQRPIFQLICNLVGIFWYLLLLFATLILISFAEQNAEQHHGKRLYKDQ